MKYEAVGQYVRDENRFEVAEVPLHVPNRSEFAKRIANALNASEPRNALPNGLTLLQKNPDYAVDLRGGKWHGWVFSKGADGQWVSNRQLSQWEIMQAEDQRDSGIVIHSPGVRAG